MHQCRDTSVQEEISSSCPVIDLKNDLDASALLASAFRRASLHRIALLLLYCSDLSRQLATLIIQMALIRLTLCVAAASAFVPRPNLGVTAPSRRAPPVHAAVLMGRAKNGIFSPIVRLAKRIVGKERFLSFRGRVIGAHTKVIQAFVDTSDSPFGCLALEKLFEMADLDGDGTIDRDELEKALKKLGFYHLSGAQLDAIMKRADEDDNCVIDYDEFVKEAPKTLKTNLVKLAKNNGAELGFLS
jgi:uncharacterized tellurite resistance protein B-like protein